jgi:hypothetical protein
MNFSTASVLASLCKPSVHIDGGTIAEQVRRYLGGSSQSAKLVKYDSGHAFAAPGYHEEIDSETAQEIVFAAQQILALPFQRLSGGQMLNFLSAQAAPRNQYYLFFIHALGFSFVGMCDGTTEKEAIQKYHSLSVAESLRKMRHQPDAVKPSQAALSDALLVAPHLNELYSDQIEQIRQSGGPLYKYRVAFVELEHHGDVQFFECQAEDYAHAMEQAHSSYPDAVLLHAYEPAVDLVF